MRPAVSKIAWVPLLAAMALTWSFDVNAQAFSAEYELARRAGGSIGLDPEASYRTLNLGPVRIAPSLQAGERYSGGGLSFKAGRHWFGLVGVGRSLQPSLSMGSGSPADVVTIAGGYRWSEGESVSLHLTGGRGSDRLGLALRYDWPRYFMRLTYDSKVDLVPQESWRFSAGMRF